MHCPSHARPVGLASRSSRKKLVPPEAQRAPNGGVLSTAPQWGARILTAFPRREIAVLFFNREIRRYSARNGMYREPLLDKLITVVLFPPLSFPSNRLLGGACMRKGVQLYLFCRPLTRKTAPHRTAPPLRSATTLPWQRRSRYAAVPHGTYGKGRTWCATHYRCGIASIIHDGPA